MTERVWDRFLTEQDKQVFAAGGFGATAGFGKRPALLIIDISYAFTGDKSEPILESMKRYRSSCGTAAWEAIPVNRKLIDAAHDKGVPVIYTTNAWRDDQWDAGSWRFKINRWRPQPQQKHNLRDLNQIVDEIAPQPQDLLVVKQKPSGFFATPMLSYLVNLNCDSVVVTGTSTSGCVRATVLDAFSYNYRVAVVEDACFDRSQASHAVTLCDMHAKYADVVRSDEVIRYFRELSDGLFPNLPKG
jgi:nicotinamidase-related amidase